MALSSTSGEKQLHGHSITQLTALFGRRFARHRALLEIGPLAFTIAALSLKLAYFSGLVPTEWWAGDEITKQWLRPAFHTVRFLVSHPHVLSATVASVLLMLTPFPLLSRTWRFVSLLTFNLIVTTLGVADVVHARFYGDVVSVSDLVLAPALGGVLPSILKLLRITDVIYYLDIFVGFAILPIYVNSCRKLGPSDVWRPARVSAGLALAALLVVGPTAWMIWENRRDFFSDATVRTEAASSIGILPYHLADILVHVASTRSEVDAGLRARVYRFLTNRDKRQPPRSPLAGIARGRNLVVISAESLQAFPIGLQINGQPVMPRFSAFAKESLDFVNFYDQTHLGTTADAEFMAMQSLHPVPAGVLATHFNHHHYRGLPKILAENGYTTLSLCAAPSNFWNMDQMHPRYGFQKSYFDESFRMVDQIHSWLSDGEFFSQSIPILLQQKQPFMAFLLSSSNHHPYPLPQAYRELKLGDLEGTLLGDYLHSVHYFDRVFGEFLDKLRSTGLLEKSVILIYGDHQGFLGDPPELARLLGFSPGNDFRLLQTRKNVPLFIRLPHGAKAGRRDIPGGAMDIAPTLLSLLGVVDDSKVMLGSDLTERRDSLVVFRDGSFTDGKHYFMKRFGPVSGGSCFNVKTGVVISCDPVRALRETAMERLEISDLIIRGDLIPGLTRRQRIAKLTHRPATHTIERRS
jgi:phosphoglycerol transferase MdoB-like AlkP superfamily enzyme